jgi:hypothetical protein
MKIQSSPPSSTFKTIFKTKLLLTIRHCNLFRISLLTCMNLVFNTTLNLRNEYSIITVLVFLSTVTVVLSLTYVTHEGRASSSTNDSSSLTETVQLGAPFYVQNYKANLSKPQPSNESIAGNFTGQGILNGNLSISAEVNFTRTFRDNDTAFLQGDTKLVGENEDTAMYSYDAFTNYNQDGTSEGRGAAVFDDGATGDLSFLSNSLAIYKNRVDSSGNGTFLMWLWK